MNWLFDLFAGSTIAHALFVYSIVIAIGVILGKVKFLGISLGATFVLFVGILMGHIGNLISPDEAFINHNTLKFIQEFGLILFVFSIGLQVGPSFFSTIKDGGMLLNGLAVCIILLNIVVALAIYFGIGGVAPNEIVGILSGAVTNTPGLGAAQQALIETQGDAAGALNESMAMGYAAAYPLGVVGIILSIILVKVIFKVNIKHDAKEIEDDNANSLLKPHVVTYKVTNKLIFDRSIKRLHDIMDRNFVISRLKKHDGEIVIPVADTIVSEGCRDWSEGGFRLESRANARDEPPHSGDQQRIFGQKTRVAALA